MKSLYGRLSLVFLIILLMMGSLMLWLAHRNSQAYFLEFTQELNRPIAMYMAQNANLAIADGLNIDALAELAPHVMMINPSVEVYLLDVDGHVVGHSLKPDEIELNRVSLEPINEFLSDSAVYPLFGDNPKNSEEKRIFTAFPLTDKKATLGYVYAVLAGENHQTLLASIESSRSFKTLAVALACIMLFALATGCIIFFMLTHRLRSLTRSVQKWQKDTNPEQAPLSVISTSGLDEIDELNQAYESMAKNLLEQYQALEKSDQNRRDLFANISHDLRTPLTTLQGYLETILLKHQSLSSEEQHRYLKIAHKQSKHIRKLVAQLFELSKLNSGEFKLEAEVFSLQELVYDTAQEFEIHAQRKNLTVKVLPQGNTNQNFNVIADIALIHRVFDNLIGNAIRFTPENGHITIHLQRLNPQRVSVSISDNGCGMSIDDAQHVFERHYKPASSKTRDSGHAGLGLAIVQSILDLHECDIEISSTPGEGTTFWFELPASSVQLTNTTLLTA